jgi:uncharacterized cupin superfamily protein
MSHKLLRVSPSVENQTAEPVAEDRVISGKPMQRLNNVFENTKENFFCGVWESTEGKWNLEYTEDEFCYIIEGQAIVTDADGHSEEVKQGDAFVIPAGFTGTWETKGKVKKFYSIYEEA